METSFYKTRSIPADSLFASMWLLVEGQPMRIDKVRWGTVTEIWLERGLKMTLKPTDCVNVIQCQPGRIPVPFTFS